MGFCALSTKSCCAQVGWHQVCEFNYVFNVVLKVLLQFFRAHLIRLILLLSCLLMLLHDLLQRILLLLFV